MTAPTAKIGILSIGDMGMGIAKLLIANGLSVATNIKGRSEETITRAKSAQVTTYTSDDELISSCDVILSVVPPRDAEATAQRIIDAVTGPFPRSSSSPPLYFADLNAVAPSTARGISALFNRTGDRVRFIDGAIIGGPPTLKTGDSAPPNNGEASTAAGWTVPSIPMSGPFKLSEIPEYGAHLSTTLNTRHISDTVGAASGLKMCFASLTKGFTSLAIQSFTTAGKLGVLDELKGELQGRVPGHWTAASRGAVAMGPKAYRWVREMEEIALTFDQDGGFPPDLFRAVAGVYSTVAEDTVLGEEKVGKRKRGLDVDDVAAAVAEGLEKKRKKND